MGACYILCGPPPVEVKDAFAADFAGEGGKKWSEMDGGEKGKYVGTVLAKLALALAALYFFICSLSFLAGGFRLGAQPMQRRAAAAALARALRCP